MKRSHFCFASFLLFLAQVTSLYSDSLHRQVSDGALRGSLSGDGQVIAFKGIPYAAPPVGNSRWKKPQPVASWEGVRDATRFGPRAMQQPIWDDMFFFDEGPSEDCLYLNVWTPADQDLKNLPVMFWIHGGGFLAGGTSEPRQNGEELAKKGVIVVSVGYRMGVFGFMAHPELTKESPDGASGNYGLLDMVAALQWVQENIEVFGGDVGNVTIFGESAGSWAVSSLIASPLAEGLFHKAIAQSGAVLNPWRNPPALAEAEKVAVDFASEHLGASSLKELRALSGKELMDTQWAKAQWSFSVCVDGLFFPKAPQEIFDAKEQNHVPLMAGWTLDESGPGGFLEQLKPTVANFETKAQEVFGERADEFLAVYSPKDKEEVIRAAADFAGDRFISHGTWRLIEAQSKDESLPVYRYRFDQTLPLPADAPKGTRPRAAHAWEIEYVFDVIDSKDLPWRDSDREVAKMMADYWTNFAKSADPNGAGLPEWPAYNRDPNKPVLHIDATPSVSSDTHRERYEFLDSFTAE
ncbi:carboxylesterase/lipase family protein [Pelagicoccus mobilis]|uniref:Carboxylic ester hydrolase n=1 Tax=Pelagicoccus mobilis TaxID=415221 RepID=A0A934VL94_9BACT|nr:carboxylesterase family protein [Pelagicoccus mobilis]MBK1877521.1 carboxylesterase family protein [Pelagicoccus mobilis]